MSQINNETNNITSSITIIPSITPIVPLLTRNLNNMSFNEVREMVVSIIYGVLPIPPNYEDRDKFIRYCIDQKSVLMLNDIPLEISDLGYYGYHVDPRSIWIIEVISNYIYTEYGHIKHNGLVRLCGSGIVEFNSIINSACELWDSTIFTASTTHTSTINTSTTAYTPIISSETTDKKVKELLQLLLKILPIPLTNGNQRLLFERYYKSSHPIYIINGKSVVDSNNVLYVFYNKTPISEIIFEISQIIMKKFACEMNFELSILDTTNKRFVEIIKIVCGEYIGIKYC